ncbi:hypothetical protein MMC30_005551 [Trapelia coarctata]|nr:hypothetical protein [Trapelia coarctata]
MEATMMVIPDHRQHRFHDMAARRMIAPGIDLSMSLYSNAGMGYTVPFQNTGFNYNFQQGNTMSFDSFAHYDHQPLASLPPLFTSQPEQLSPPCARYPLSRACEPLHVKVEESSPIEAFAGLPSGDGVPGIDDDTTFGTDVDTLMRTIQTKTKAKTRTPQDYSPQASVCASYGEENSTPTPIQEEFCSRNSSPWSGAKARKTYQCDLPTCAKLFYQKTHLEIHMRAHTGYKPFLCREPSCGQRFSQLGNLKTHERRHTGERPYSCEACGKRFAQRGNVRAHRTVHEQTKPFSCRLEECGKQFTQLGNLKSHQNKFHAEALRQLTVKFAAMQEGDAVSAADKELWEYFSTLYKNSNKGIKGRGKDRKISATFKDHDTAKREDRNGSSSSDGEHGGSYALTSRQPDHRRSGRR